MNLVVRLHYLKLHESPVVDGDDYERMKMKWILDQVETKPKRDMSSNDDEGEDKWPGIAPGDLVVFSELSSGAGELEGTRIIGSSRSSDGSISLLPCGIESPVFPQEIAQLAQSKETTLRAMYEKPLNAILDEDCGMALEDLFGGEGVVEEFWASPETAAAAASEVEWRIPLDGCTWSKSISFPVVTE
mmetsp:Transcript_9124/g.12120  ORF Transcript_9124/g.12120 Transcript_9124/m.12120 type:complete len:188 (-) Transcript_9124:41-604(-)